MTPAFARETQSRLDTMFREGGEKPGKVLSIEFQRVNPETGEDVYRVDYENRTFDWAMLMDSNGKVAQAWLTEVLK